MAHYVCQERYGSVISQHGNQTQRVARFLKPCATSSDEAESVSARAHLLFEEMSSRQLGWPKKVNFQGWACPQKNWDKWVEKLEVRHSFMWKRIGIYDAIMGSCYDIRRNKEIVLGLVEFWCSEMNTFVFPWGEATITLEDEMILGGFSVLGEPIKKHVTTKDLMIVVDALLKRKSAISKGKSKKCTHGAWMKHFMENENGSEVEHAGFLSYWLSRYVFPLPTRETVSKDVFPIAAHLAGGTQMALAPAVLAGLYNNLSLLKEKALSSFDDDEITVIASFRLVLLWASEHFPRLVQKPPNVLKPGEPRAARWYKVINKIDKSVIDPIFLSGQCFQWRPYAADISNWNHSSYYRAEEHLEIDSEEFDQNLQCYLICMTMCYLVGLDCREKYMPHRVTMQFGIDQDLPGEFSGLVFGPKDVCFFVPPRSFEPGISLKYFNWWKNSEFICGGKLPNVLRRSLDTFQMPPSGGEMSSKDYHTPSVTTRLKDIETVPRSSIKEEVIEIRGEEWEFGKWNKNFDLLFKSVFESDFPTREAGSLERRSRSIEEVKGGGGSNTSAESFDAGSPECSTPCPVRVRSLASITRELSPTQRFQGSVVTDHFAVMGTPKEMAKDSNEIDDNHSLESRNRANGWNRKATSDEVHLNETIKKRKLSTLTEEGSDCKKTISIMNGNTDEMQGGCVNATMDVYEKNFDILILDLEKRIEKLEKQKGINPDRG
ncbi:LOW QUALITY PROTEIN: uncharacterized protein LOC120086874 [Benincasa hispida]|uniref:LOW QUALITY PROTEIN: uncharacterized protein LOC120086874 n=1 Tax=Benincasa hispida TaxID=102211 RepID=UPI0019005EDE|nr:LOW QUALITY PROTEIN: uncharacterized protein LOC120086874 [Benincasa hispida]